MPIIINHAVYHAGHAILALRLPCSSKSIVALTLTANLSATITQAITTRKRKILELFTITASEFLAEYVPKLLVPRRISAVTKELQTLLMITIRLALFLRPLIVLLNHEKPTVSCAPPTSVSRMTFSNSSLALTFLLLSTLLILSFV